LESDELEETTKPRPKKKQNTTHQQIQESESEVELVDNAEPFKEEVESVDETHGSKEVLTEQEVIKSDSRILLFREATNPLACTPCS
jgi:hypothetical protein